VKPFQTFQSRVQNWMIACFGKEITQDTTERNHRFIEESLELAQSLGCSKSQIIELIDYVYSRPIGETKQEVGGVLLTLSALCSANNIDLAGSGEAELVRVWVNIKKIREKRSQKHLGSVLP
jgi:NTP pyrophosphatase (non-canonical NTP hydrolase)